MINQSAKETRQQKEQWHCCWEGVWKKLEKEGKAI